MKLTMHRRTEQGKKKKKKDEEEAEEERSGFGIDDLRFTIGYFSECSVFSVANSIDYFLLTIDYCN